LPKATLAGVEFEIDEDGFIQEPEKWSEAVAEDLAKEESLPAIWGGPTSPHAV
jgi:tRNA 2-thiouridine synthesizing protein E